MTTGRTGNQTMFDKLISRRKVKNRGEVDEFNIEWSLRDSFLRRSEQ
jgi:hypothetical protein